MAKSNPAWLWICLPAAAFLTAFAPMFWNLIQGPWQTEQEGHGPLIIAASIWLVWEARRRLTQIQIAPAPVAGWALLFLGLTLMFLSRTQGVISVEVLSAIISAAACILLMAGVPMLRALAFPLAFLLFAVPLPDWIVDAATIPLKVLISDAVTRLLYVAGYPIAQNGVVIVIGPYQLLVKDACSGMNSIFALSAIGVFYVFVIRRYSISRSAALLTAIVPVAVAANFLRVLALVLIAYHDGIDTLSGPLHMVTGLGLFVVALILLCTFDALLGLGMRFYGAARRHRPVTLQRRSLL